MRAAYIEEAYRHEVTYHLVRQGVTFKMGIATMELVTECGKPLSFTTRNVMLPVHHAKAMSTAKLCHHCDIEVNPIEEAEIVNE